MERERVGTVRGISLVDGRSPDQVGVDPWLAVSEDDRLDEFNGGKLLLNSVDVAVTDPPICNPWSPHCCVV